MSSSSEGKAMSLVVFCVSSQDGDNYRITMNRKEKLEKMMKTYCKSKKLNYENVLFLFKLKKVHSTQTPDEIGLEDGDVMDAFMHQTGGGGGGGGGRI